MRKPWSWLAATAVAAALLYLCWPEPEAPAAHPVQQRPPAGAAAAAADAEPAAPHRVASALPATATAAAEPLAAAVATGALQITVVSEAFRPLPGCTVGVAGEPELAAVTDARGVAELTLPCGMPMLQVTPADARFVATDGRVRVEPGRRAFTVALALRCEMPFAVRVLGGEPPRPLAGVRAALLVHGVAALEQITGPTGLVTVLAPRRDAALLLAGGDAFGPSLVLPAPGHETEAVAMPVLLPPAATLAVRVLDAADRPLAGVAVTVQLDRRDVTQPAGAFARGEVPKFAGTTDASGEVLAARLAAGARAEVLVQHGRAPESGSLRLVPGANTLTIRCSDLVLRGRVLDDAGAPLAGVEVGVRPWPYDAPLLMLGSAGGDGDVRTAGDGSFAFEHLAVGTWLVGVIADAAAEPVLTPVCQVVELRPGVDTAVELRAQRGGFVAGTARLPDGAPAAGVGLDLLTATPAPDYVATARAAADGSFRIGPLPPGEWTLQGEVYGGVFGLPRPVAVRTGDDDVQLQLQRTMAAVRAQVVDAEGRPRRAWVLLHSDGDDALGFRSGLDGSFEPDGLRAGNWAAYAEDGSGGVAVLFDLDLQPAPVPTPLRLQLQPGGTVVLHGPDEADRNLVCRLAGRVGYRDGIAAGETRRLLLPPGEWVLELCSGARVLRRSAVRVEAGRDHEVAWR